MSPDQIQDIVLGTVHGMITSGDLVTEMPTQDRGDMVQEQMMPPQGMPQEQMMPPQGMPQEQMMPPQGMPQEQMAEEQQMMPPNA